MAKLRRKVKASISETRWLQARAENQGFCTECRIFTRNGVAPEDEGLSCPHCRQQSVRGVENALFVELLEVG